MIKKVKHLLKKVFFFILYRDKNIYYGKNYNSLNFLHLLFWNLVRPGRSLTRIKYNRFLLPKRLKKIDSNTSVNIKNLSKDKIIELSAQKLKKYGTVTLNQYFDENVLSKFENEYKNYFNTLSQQPSNSYSFSNVLPFSKILTDLWFDETIIGVMEKYIKRLPVARSYPVLQSATPKHNDGKKGDDKEKTGFADWWHLDHSTLIQAAIYFTDVEEGNSHMQVLPGTHTYPNVANPNYLSNEYVSKNNLTINKCIGKRGSVQIHCGNVYHRFKAIQNTTRTWIKFDYTSGNNITLNSEGIGKMLKDDFNLSTLDNRSRKIISGLFPLSLTKGYEIEKKSFRPSKFKGV